jgi:hypothetical protein
MAIIVDIDNTIVRNGDNPIQKNIDYINSLGERKIIITGRPESDRTDTVSMLKSIGFSYSRLIMNPGSTADSNTHKKESASKLTDIVLAIDDNPGARRAYNSIGIKTMDPATI